MKSVTEFDKKSRMPLSEADLRSFRERIRRLAKSEDFSLDNLLASATDVIVFGSRAAGLERVRSDLDLLAIGTTKLRKRFGLIDLICVPEPDAHSLAWQHSEIFRHVAAYGISLIHDHMLIEAVVDEHAADRKRRRLETLLEKLLGSWNTLNDGYKAKYLTKLRREFQRYKLLESGLAVPPTACLDSQVNSQEELRSTIEELLLQLSFGESATVERAKHLLLNEAYRLRSLLARNAGDLSIERDTKIG